ncbi:hypothetical protein ASPVEDRAFT_150796 [Aspergillus versicolor CBS 583.65]|uniref:Uncharacterized protein n=1 Tax=Aspergillus versicolor CBS 583.65 TaxID=1036611 RepID=A0A1L9PKY5_ASPVE|nr:uncharacterized protein ASPVEDRAFT_150796 [Aspergillus versicolor CBS 583.65]OJJ02095.1 hypothetical protein ASPVEDRAFT_150796 [Aspergillus versicolor CBS 583.65]
MEKQPATNYDGAQATGVRVDDPSADGLDRDRAYDSGFKYQIPEAEQQNTSEPSYQPHAAVGADKPKTGTQTAGGDIGETLGGGVRGVFAGIHGAGEWLRGGLNSAVDRAFGSDEGATRNDAISRAGQEQIRTGKFSGDTHGK